MTLARDVKDSAIMLCDAQKMSAASKQLTRLAARGLWIEVHWHCALQLFSERSPFASQEAISASLVH